MIKHIALSLSIVILAGCKEDRSTTQVKAAEVVFKKEGNLELIKTKNDSVYKTLDIEVADNDYERQTGLMYRIGMENNQAMLFVFPNAQYHSFYMKNTQFPIDIIFLGSDMKIINIKKEAQPLDESSILSEGPAQYVLEINAGLSEQWGIQKGDSISFNY